MFEPNFSYRCIFKKKIYFFIFFSYVPNGGTTLLSDGPQNLPVISSLASLPSIQVFQFLLFSHDLSLSSTVVFSAVEACYFDVFIYIVDVLIKLKLEYFDFVPIVKIKN